MRLDTNPMRQRGNVSLRPRWRFGLVLRRIHNLSVSLRLWTALDAGRLRVLSIYSNRFTDRNPTDNFVSPVWAKSASGFHPARS